MVFIKILVKQNYFIFLFIILVYKSLYANVISNDSNFSKSNSSGSIINNQILNENVIKSTFDVLYIVPENIDDVLTLNEKHTIGNGYDKGWILPSDEPLSLNLYLYYDGHDESKLKPFLRPEVIHKLNNSDSNQRQILDDSKENQALVQSSLSSATLVLFFTPENNCEDYMKRNYWPFEIVERIASNMYRAKLNSITLTYSNKPLHICMQQFDSDENIHDQLRFYSHQGDDYWVSIITTKSLIPIWARIILFIILLSLSGLFSGLNLGLMSLDLTELEILKRIGTPSEQSYASKIYPLRKRGNFLLCTILLGNVLVNSVSTLILGDMLSGIYAAFGSTILIVIFGEIIPQAACSKHGLAVGAYTRYITYIFMCLTAPLSFPLSIVLDKVLGQEMTATYSREKIREMMNVVEGLDDKEKKIISGALDFNNKKVREVMTKLDDVFMLEIKSSLDFEAIAKIAQEGYSRIPVHEGPRDNIVGLLHVKDFTLLDPDDNMPVEALLKFYNHAVIFCDAEESIDERFEEFRKGETHLAFVNDVITQSDKDPFKTCVGIVTLEDIIEELVQMEIYDEFDDKKEIEVEESKNSKSYNDESGYEKLKESEINETEMRLLNKTNSTAENPNQTESNLDQKISRLNSTSGVSNQNDFKEISTNDQSIDLNSSLNKTQKSIKSNQSNHKTTYENQTSKDLSFFLQQQKDNTQKALISPQIRFVMFQFLFTSVKPFTDEFLTKNVLEFIFTKAVFKESRRSDAKLPREYLYRYGKGCNYFILILSGEATIEVGKEKLEFSAGPFAYFGVNALLCGIESSDQLVQDEQNNADSGDNKKSTNKQYIPDFSLRVDEKCVYMKIDRDLWKYGVLKSRLELSSNQMSDNMDLVQPSNEHINPTAESDYSIKSSKPDLSSFFINKSPSPFLKQSVPNGRNRRSYSMAANVLEKAQEALNAKQNQNKISDAKHYKSDLNEVQELSDSLDNINTRKNEELFKLISEQANNSIDIDSEQQPFISKILSTTSLNVNSAANRKKNNTKEHPEKHQTMSQQSLDQKSDY